MSEAQIGYGTEETGPLRVPGLDRLGETLRASTCGWVRCRAEFDRSGVHSADIGMASDFAQLPVAIERSLSTPSTAGTFAVPFPRMSCMERAFGTTEVAHLEAHDAIGAWAAEAARTRVREHAGTGARAVVGPPVARPHSAGKVTCTPDRRTGLPSPPIWSRR